ncbi:MAG: tetraacyldisaccharide 4'-kinase [Desulfobacterales bacterium]|nr:tetraacyldisaccharide 4'-kinase [Desulfobacterales bacterium]
MQNRIEQIINNQDSNRYLFFYLISLLYGYVMNIRAKYYKKHGTKSLPCKVISIGNLTVGGTGKTPTTIYIAKLVKDLGYKTAVISRGYRGSKEKTGGVVSNGKNIFMSVEEAGDEPFMMANILEGIPVFIGKDRFNIGMLAFKTFKPDIIILDDAFQHLKVMRDINLLLLDSNKPFGNGYILPRGTLREPISSINRADAIIFTRYNTKYLLPAFNTEKTFKSFYIPNIPDSLESHKIFVFSGIAKNKDFREMLSNFDIKGFMEYPDHHTYSEKDIENIIESAKKNGADMLVTTEKDYVKIENKLNISIPIIKIGIEVSFGNDNERFKDFIKKRLSF